MLPSEQPEEILYCGVFPAGVQVVERLLAIVVKWVRAAPLFDHEQVVSLRRRCGSDDSARRFQGSPFDVAHVISPHSQTGTLGLQLVAQILHLPGGEAAWVHSSCRIQPTVVVETELCLRGCQKFPKETEIRVNALELEACLAHNSEGLRD